MKADANRESNGWLATSGGGGNILTHRLSCGGGGGVEHANNATSTGAGSSSDTATAYTNANNTSNSLNNHNNEQSAALLPRLADPSSSNLSRSAPERGDGGVGGAGSGSGSGGGASQAGAKEKKSSVGYRLGKRKLLFEKRRQISDYALMFAMTGVFLMIIETEFSMSKMYTKVRYARPPPPPQHSKHETNPIPKQTEFLIFVHHQKPDHNHNPHTHFAHHFVSRS